MVVNVSVTSRGENCMEPESNFRFDFYSLLLLN